VVRLESVSSAPSAAAADDGTGRMMLLAERVTAASVTRPSKITIAHGRTRDLLM
jgi:hypothetical protein